MTSNSVLMAYILRHRPDEFGLVLDEDGFISLKELLQAIGEEEGWSYVRRSHITEVAYTSDRERFEIQDEKIRAIPWRQAQATSWQMDGPSKGAAWIRTRKSFGA